MENASQGLTNNWWYLIIGLIILVVGIFIGIIIGKIKNSNNKFFATLSVIYKNLDNFILILSTILLLVSIVLISIGVFTEPSAIILSTFSSVVFSWLLTKKSAKAEFKEQEADLALKSYRHLNYISSTAQTAYKELEVKINSPEEKLSDAEKNNLNIALEKIKIIQGGIDTCNMDWQDMLSENYREKYCYNGDDKNPNYVDKYGLVTVCQEEMLNQEDA